MLTIHEVATVTSKGRIALPKLIRQFLDISVGDKIAFDLRGTEMVVSKVEQEIVHEDLPSGLACGLWHNTPR